MTTLRQLCSREILQYPCSIVWLHLHPFQQRLLSSLCRLPDAIKVLALVYATEIRERMRRISNPEKGLEAGVGAAHKGLPDHVKAVVNMMF